MTDRLANAMLPVAEREPCGQPTGDEAAQNSTIKAMSSDDPRHGTPNGYQGQGCRCTPCRTAHARYSQELALDRLRGIVRLLPVTGTQRRLYALQALGWPLGTIAEHLGTTRGSVSQLLYPDRLYIRRSTAQRINAIYEDLCMTPGPSSRTRAHAARSGWLPPLAWDDIDDPNERPRISDGPGRRARYDHAVVERFLAGEDLATTVPERIEITRRWRAMGRSMGELHRRTGWATHRYAGGKQNVDAQDGRNGAECDREDGAA